MTFTNKILRWLHRRFTLRRKDQRETQKNEERSIYGPRSDPALLTPCQTACAPLAVGRGTGAVGARLCLSLMLRGPASTRTPPRPRCRAWPRAPWDVLLGFSYTCFFPLEYFSNKIFTVLFCHLTTFSTRIPALTLPLGFAILMTATTARINQHNFQPTNLWEEMLVSPSLTISSAQFMRATLRERHHELVFDVISLLW